MRFDHGTCVPGVCTHDVLHRCENLTNAVGLHLAQNGYFIPISFLGVRFDEIGLWRPGRPSIEFPYPKSPEKTCSVLWL